MSALDGPPTVVLPAPVDRRLRLGPFPTAGCALRFVAYSSVGIGLAVSLAPLAWVPFVLGGFVLSVHQTGGKPLDEFAAGFVRWKLRRVRPKRLNSRHGPRASRATRCRIPSGRWVAIVRTGGLPVAFLPPDDARSLFVAYRELVRSVSGGLFLRATSEPIPPSQFRLPGPVASDCPVRDARDGYAELLRLLLRHRRRRTVDVVLWSSGTGTGGASQLEERVRLMSDGLSNLGLECRRLVGAELVGAAERFGWAVEELA